MWAAKVISSRFFVVMALINFFKFQYISFGHVGLVVFCWTFIQNKSKGKIYKFYRDLMDIKQITTFTSFRQSEFAVIIIESKIDSLVPYVGFPSPACVVL